MKITVSFIGNMFIVILAAILPYISFLRSYMSSSSNYTGDDFILGFLIKELLLSVIVYAISVFGFTMAENNAKELGKEKQVSFPYFTLIFSIVLLQYFVGIFSSILPDYIIINFTPIKSIILLILFIWTFITFFRFSRKSTLFLIPFFVWFVYIYIYKLLSFF